jgi:CubicO group peptidase (beta-lactamase class C family)
MPSNRSKPYLAAVFGLVSLTGCVAAGQAPDTAPPDAAMSEASAPTPTFDSLRDTDIMLWTPAQQRLGYPIIEKLIATGTVRPAERPRELPAAPRDWSTFTYTHGGRTLGLDDFVRELNVVGLVVVADGAVVLERYADGHDAQTPWTAFSVTKSITSLLFGAAIEDGYLQNMDEQVVRWVPALAGTAYDGVTLRQLLQMTSGVAWSSDLADISSNTYQLSAIDKAGGLDALLRYLGGLPRAAEPGTKFTYNTADADVAAAVLRAATGRTLSDYLTEEVWQPFGMEHEAHWVRLRGGDLEHGDCCLSMTLRDQARVGLFALAGGALRDGTNSLPAGWMAESTGSGPAFPGYGYYWWLRPSGGYFASGSFGQHIEVAPAERVVVAIQSYWPKPYDDELIGHNDAVVKALIEAVAGGGDSRIGKGSATP